MANKIKVPKYGKRTIPARDLHKWEQRGYKFHRELGDSAYVMKKRYSDWEQFEMRVRTLFQQAGFENCISEIEDFFFTDYGPQIDVCGGVDSYFVVIDCTQSTKRHPISLIHKIRENHAKKARIERAVKAKFGKYKEVIVAVCVDGVEVRPPDIRESKELGIPLLDCAFFSSFQKHLETMGPTLRYQLLARLGVKGIPIDGHDAEYKFPAMALRSGNKTMFSFCASPEELLQLCYVYRIDRFAEKGYQRELLHKKLRDLNSFLARDGYHATNLVICFDSKKQQLRFVDGNGRVISDPEAGQQGTLKVPKEYCSAELIDGQHRLYGYLDFTGNPQIADQVSARRKADRINVVAVDDPGEEERPLLFVDINCNQTKVSMRNIWALMGDVRPTSQMGYIANLVKALNGTGPLRGKIHVPGKNTAGERNINIANLGKGIKDRQLVSKPGRKDDIRWNLFDGERKSDNYPEHPSPDVIRDFNIFLIALKSSAQKDWQRQGAGFLLTNNGLNVMLRVFAVMLKHLHSRGERYTSASAKRLLGKRIGLLIEREGSKQLRGQCSSEDGRAKVAQKFIDHLGIGERPRVMAARA